MNTSSTLPASMEFLGMTHKYIRVATYARCSDPYEDQKTIESQTDAMRLYAQRQGWALNDCHVYEEAVTGYLKPFRERKRFTELLDAARRHEFDIVLVNEFSRLSRKQAEQAVMIDLLEQCGVRVESVTEKYEDSPIGHFMRNVYAFLSEIEREKILERLNRGKMKKVKSGAMLGQGKACYGYSWNTERTGYVVSFTPIFTDEAGFVWSEAIVIQFIFSQLKNRISQRRIALYLNELGIPTRKGAPWSQSVIHKIATNCQYAGDAYALRVKRENGKQLARPIEEQIPLPEGTIPPLVSREDFDEVQQILKDNKAFSDRNNGEPHTALMRSLIKCSICGFTMHVRRFFTYRPDRADLYFCTKKTGREGEHHAVSIPVYLVDEKAWEITLSYILDPSLLQQAVEQLLVTLQTQQETEESITRQLTEIKRKYANLWTMAENCTDNDMLLTLAARLRDLDSEKRKLEHYQQGIVAENEFKRKIEKEIRRFVEWTEKVRPLLSDPLYQPTYEEKRLAVIILGIRAKVWKPDSAETLRFKIEVAPPNILNLFSEHNLFKYECQLPLAVYTFPNNST